jgi:hypothetical protein
MVEPGDFSDLDIAIYQYTRWAIPSVCASWTDLFVRGLGAPKLACRFRSSLRRIYGAAQCAQHSHAVRLLRAAAELLGLLEFIQTLVVALKVIAELVREINARRGPMPGDPSAATTTHTRNLIDQGITFHLHRCPIIRTFGIAQRICPGISDPLRYRNRPF